jgi:predicted transposase YbfD/YdcC
VLALKGNQGGLHEAVVDYFRMAHMNELLGAPVDYFEELDSGHGRVEVRRYWTSPIPDTLPNIDAWKKLTIIGMAESERYVGDTVSVERCYYISSLSSDARQFGGAVRTHWGIENSVHWVLDVTLREDECRIRRDEAAENLATLRHFVLNLLKGERTMKKSVKRKRLKAAWDDDYRAKVLFG